MATLRNKRKLAALNKEDCEEHSRSNLAQKSNVPRSEGDYIIQVAEKIEGRVTNKLSQEFSRTENYILGSLARLDDFLMEPLIQGHSGTALETCRNAIGTNHGISEDESQNYPHPEAGIFSSQTAQNFGPEIGHDMVTGVHEVVTSCSPSTSSGKLNMNRFISHPQFRCENKPATIETEQILSALHQLANNKNSANFLNNFNRFSKLPKSLTTTMPTFAGKSEKIELFENLFQIHNQTSKFIIS